MVKFALILLFLLLHTAMFANAAPIISSTDASWAHGSSVTISGSNFGTKSPVAPFWWDDCEDKTVDSYAALDAQYDDVMTNAHADNDKDIQYRDVPYDGMSAPHSHSTKYISGVTEEGGAYDGYVAKQNTGAVNPTDFFSTWYYRDQDNPPCPAGSARNHKVAIFSSNAPFAEGISLVANYSNGRTDICFDDPALMVTWYGGSSGTNTDTHLNTSPRLEWIRQTTWGRVGTSNDSDGFYKLYSDEELCSYNDDDPWGSSTEILNWIAAGGYFRACSGCDDELRYYYDDIYMDWSLARVMLANNATYTNATIVEPQIPHTTWNATTIQITVNQGNLPNGTAYLFVFDSDDDANGTGFEVTLTDESTAINGISGSGFTIQ